ncbi:glycerate kinase [Microbacterium invictum]|uniref:Glycerate kinase n=1 Tax=Microbacterium invictum TaxID=515415 RepID=A0AA40VNW2_9MICO|nr:glycerate kinase [Microbacterium invictum]MBB4141214.1 glycerate kinase [Microbacterium invictum]
MPRVVFALDSFKGSIGAADAAAAVADGWQAVGAALDAVARPMADGGEGTVSAFAAAVDDVRRMPVTVRGPNGRDVDAEWLLLPDGTGVVELASTSGIELLGDQRLPWDADTFGFGQAVAAALDHGVTRLVLGIGSSASTDGGVGMLTALGARVLDSAGSPVAPGARGLADIVSVEMGGCRGLPASGALVLTDVTNPLLGPQGAAAVFGPQKGFDADGVTRADAGLARLAGVFAVAARSASKSGGSAAFDDPGGSGAGSAASSVDAGGSGTAAAFVDPAEPGTGAAGGTGFALRAWGAQLVPGAGEVAELIGLRAAIEHADLVVTGEGSFDGQSAAGKVPTFVAELAADAGVAVALVAGRIAEDADVSAFAASLSLSELAGSPAASLADPARWLRDAGGTLADRFARGA